MIADIKGKGEIMFAEYVTVPYTLALVTSDKNVTELDTESINIENRVTKGKPVKGAENTVKVVALKYKSNFPAQGQQLKF